MATILQFLQHLEAKIDYHFLSLHRELNPEQRPIEEEFGPSLRDLQHIDHIPAASSSSPLQKPGAKSDFDRSLTVSHQLTSLGDTSSLQHTAMVERPDSCFSAENSPVKTEGAADLADHSARRGTFDLFPATGTMAPETGQASLPNIAPEEASHLQKGSSKSGRSWRPMEIPLCSGVLLVCFLLQDTTGTTPMIGPSQVQNMSLVLPYANLPVIGVDLVKATTEDMDNCTDLDGFIFNAFSDTKNLYVLFFLLFMFLFIATVMGNSLIILLSWSDSQLNTPMYFLLSNLSFIDICYSSTTIPQMLVIFLVEQSFISLPACIAQMYFFLSLAASESFILATMAYDRFVAICNPLRYFSIMNKDVCLQMAGGAWVTGFIYGGIHTTNTFRLSFSGTNILNHFFCDIPPLLKISCIDTYFNEMSIYIIGGFLIMGCFLLITVSYIKIIFSVLNTPKGIGRGKAFSTCVSHLIIVILFYGSGSLTYLRPKSNFFTDKEWLFSIFYTCITPLLNPMIYSFRNKDIQRALMKLIGYKYSQAQQDN
ncbi:olfactory receptor 1019-like [Bombina bombina]|uniref:olfactory receptor 1019-like n=1 Tax=Bombina bombina TaxID=8345 RepID=UPI00235ACB34|nr:olfactory receptor 1019-like [Bombina bombina]